MFESTRLEQIIAARAGRIGFGAVLIAGAIVLAHGAAVRGGMHAGAILAITWAAAFVVYGVMRHVRVRGPRTASSLLTASLMVPGIGIAFTLPLLIHLPFAVMLGGAGDGFDDWVRLSLVIAGPAHAALALLVAIRAKQLAAGAKALSPPKVYAITIAVSCIPWVMYFAIPPAIVAVTGVPFLFLLHHMQKIIDRERAELHAEVTTPRAIAYAI